MDFLKTSTYDLKQNELGRMRGIMRDKSGGTAESS